MSLSQVIKKAVDQAFLAAGDLVRQGQVKGELVSQFDFAAKEVVATTDEYFTDFITVSSVVEEDKHIKKVILLRSEDIDTSRYSTISIDSIVYRFETIEEFEGITQLTIRSV